MTQAEWQKRIEEKRFLRSEPHPRTGEVALWEWTREGELVYRGAENAARQSPSAISLR